MGKEIQSRQEKTHFLISVKNEITQLDRVIWITSGHNVYGKHINISFPREPVTFRQHFIIHSFCGWISFLRKVKLPINNIPQADTRKGPAFKDEQ